MFKYIAHAECEWCTGVKRLPSAFAFAFPNAYLVCFATLCSDELEESFTLSAIFRNIGARVMMLGFSFHRSAHEDETFSLFVSETLHARRLFVVTNVHLHLGTCTGVVRRNVPRRKRQTFFHLRLISQILVWCIALMIWHAANSPAHAWIQFWCGCRFSAWIAVSRCRQKLFGICGNQQPTSYCQKQDNKLFW